MQGITTVAFLPQECWNGTAELDPLWRLQACNPLTCYGYMLMDITCAGAEAMWRSAATTLMIRPSWTSAT